MKKFIRLLIPVLILSLVFAQGLVTQAQSPVKLVMWSIADETDALHKTMVDAVDRYNKAHAGTIQIDITYIHNDQFKPQLEIATAGGKTPDIFQTWGGGVLQAQINAGVVRDIPALLGDAGKKFSAGGFGPGTFNSKRYAVPVDLSGVFLWANNEIMEQNGVALPDTWESLIAACKTLNSKGVIPIGLTNLDKWPGAFYAYYLIDRLGGSQAFMDAFSRKTSFADPVFVQAGKMIQEAVDANCFEPGFNGNKWDQGQLLFGGGQVAMQLQGNWLIDGAKKGGLDPKNLRVVPFPKVADGKGDPTDMIGGTGQSYAISAQAPKEADEALIELLSGDEFGKSVAVDASLMPALIGADQYIPDAVVKSMAQMLSKSANIQLYWDQFLPPALAQIFLQTNQDTFGKTTTPEKAAADMEAAAKAPAATQAAK
jgi:raffinose/stachyose/melibiose transport system substrate-binding protein